MITKHQARSIIRKGVKRVPVGEEIRHLNIMPMMDIMTILLVAFILTAAESAALSIGDVELPGARTVEPLPEGAVTVTIAKQGILVDGQTVPIRMINGKVDASEIKGGALGITIPKLSKYLGDMRADNDKQLIAKGKKPPSVPEVLIISDRTTKYRLLFQVILSSRADVAGFRRFRLILLERDEPGPGG